MGLLKSLIRYLIIGTIFLFPLFFLPITQEFFVTQKFYFILFSSFVVLASIGLSILINREIHIIKSPFIRILVALLAVRIVSLLFASTNKIQALYILPTGLLPFVACFLLCICGLYIFAETKKELPIKRALGIGGMIAALVSIFFYFNPFATTQLAPSLSFLKNQQFSLMGSVFDSALFYGCMVVGGLASFFTASSQKKTSFSALKIATLLLSAIALGMMITLLLKTDAQNRRALQLPPYGASWNAAVETLKEPKTALIGVGIDNFDVLFTTTKSRAYNATRDWQVNYSLSRSTLLHAWAETGLLGLIAFLLLILYIIREVHGLFTHRDSEAYIFAFVGSYLGLVIALFPPSYIVFVLLFIYILALAQRGLHHDKDAISTVNLANMPLAYISLSLLCIGLALGIGYYAKQAYTAEIYFKKSIDAIRTNSGREVYTNLQKAIQMNSRIEKYHNQFAQINLLLANSIAQKKGITDDQKRAATQFIQQAIAEAKVLVSLNPNRASNWNTLAVIYKNIVSVAQGADAWTIASYQEAIKHDPNNPLLHLNLGGVYYGAKNYQASTLSFERAVALKTDWANAHYNYAWSLFQEGKTQQAVAVMKNVLTLLDKNSADYKTAQTNYDVFKEKLNKESTDAAKLKPELQAPTDSKAAQSPLQLPATPAAQISPGIKLPESSGPNVATTPTAAPTVAPTQAPK